MTLAPRLFLTTMGNHIRSAPGRSVTARSIWSLAFAPGTVLLGFALPLTFLSASGFLYYLRPVELLFTYGTAWLMILAVALPLSLAAALTLRGLRSLRVSWPADLAARVLVWSASGAAIETLLFCGLAWLRTFGLFSGVHGGRPLTLLAMILATLVAALARFRARFLRSIQLTRYSAALGVLAALSLLWSWQREPRHESLRAPASALSARAPHILLVTMDALSAPRMSLYGAARPTTPKLQDFARSATVFDRAYANGNFTTAGIASIMTGTRPWTHRALQLVAVPLPATRENSLPALLERAGYQTGYVSSTPYAGASTEGLGAYFDFAAHDRIPIILLCRDGLVAVLPYECAAARIPMLTFVEDRLDRTMSVFEWTSNTQYDPRPAIKSALDWLSSVDKSKPVFLWLHLFPPHGPYAAPPPWLGTFDPSHLASDFRDSSSADNYAFSALGARRARVLSARYDESVRYVDHYVGEFLDQAMKILGSNTAIIVASDHGESFAHGYGTHAGPGLFDGIIHIPLIVKLPGQKTPSRSSVVAEQVDIAPTVAQLAGVTPPESWEGHSLIGNPTSGVADQPAFSMNFEENPRRADLTTGSVAVIDGRWKLVHYMGHLHYFLVPPLHDELYDLSTDPGELHNLASANPCELNHLRGLIDAQLARHGGPVQ